MIQRRSGTLGLWNLLSGSNISSSHFRELELTAEGHEHIKMTFSYDNNWIWKKLTLKTCPQQVTRDLLNSELRVTSYELWVTFHVLWVTFHVLWVTSYISCVMSYISWVMSYILWVTFWGYISDRRCKLQVARYGLQMRGSWCAGCRWGGGGGGWGGGLQDADAGCL